MFVTSDGKYVVTDKKIDNFYDISDYGDNIIECDTLMAPIVSLLVEKGYKIVNSSQGKMCYKRCNHEEDGGIFMSLPYIKFDKDITLINILSIFSSYKRITEDFYFEVTKDGYTVLTIIDKSKNYSNINFYRFFSDICKKCSLLFNFIKYNLPDYDILKKGIENAPFDNDLNTFNFKTTQTAWNKEIDYIERNLSDTSVISVAGYSYLVAETMDNIGNMIKYIICYTTDEIASGRK